LIGAAVLVLAAVIGFPLLFDNQPRPIAVDIPIEIPDKAKVKPLPADGGMITEGPAPVSAPAPKVVASEPVKAAVAPEAKTPEKAPEKVVEKVIEKAPAAKVDDGTKAKALLEGMDVDKKPDAAAARFVVQVGAFSDVLKAREARVKLEKAGMKTYTQVVNPKEGKRIRVRVGPFESKADADKAADKIKKLDLPAAVLEL
jgi:DedD protein